MIVKRLLSAAAVTGLVLGLAACGNSDPASSAPTETPSVTTTPSETPSTETPSTETPSPSAARPEARTKAALTEALLAPSELPKGMTIDNSPEEDSDTSLKGRGCADFEKIFESDTAPGAKASVTRTFTGGQSGPYLDEALDALASPAEATALVARVTKAVTSCPKATWTLEGAGSSSVTIKKTDVRTAGGSYPGFVIKATDGALRGVEMHSVFVALGDVVLSLSADRAELLPPVTPKAVRKATLKLGVDR